MLYKNAPPPYNGGEVVDMTLGENLQRLRKAKGMSQDEVAEKLFVTRQSVSKWETNKAEPGVENLKALAKLYGVSVDVLLGAGEEPAEPSDDAAYRRLMKLRLAAAVAALLGMITVDEYFDVWLGFSVCLLPGAFVMLLGYWTRRKWAWVLLMALESFAAMLIPAFCLNVPFIGGLAIILGGCWVFRLCQNDIQGSFH